MEDLITCPVCHQPIQPTDYFCPNCGKNLRPPHLSTSLSSQLLLYTKSFFLPPMGIIWGIRYLRQPDRHSKIVGWIAITLTIITILITIQITVNLINTVNDQVDKQLQDIEGF